MVKPKSYFSNTAVLEGALVTWPFASLIANVNEPSASVTIGIAKGDAPGLGFLGNGIEVQFAEDAGAFNTLVHTFTFRKGFEYDTDTEVVGGNFSNSLFSGGTLYVRARVVEIT